jgi:hypothetical protein
MSRQTIHRHPIKRLEGDLAKRSESPDSRAEIHSSSSVTQTEEELHWLTG